MRHDGLVSTDDGTDPSTDDGTDPSADGSTDPTGEPTRSFADLGLRPELLDALAGLGYEEPTPIQWAAVPKLVEGHDLLGQAATLPSTPAAAI